jgi:hypothetical protein
MKLIISELEALRGYVSREFYYIMTELIQQYGWRQIDTFKLWRSPGSLPSKLLQACGELPEIILLWEGYSFFNAHLREIKDLGCYVWVFADDLHYWDERMKLRKSLTYLLCDTILSTYGYAFERFYPEIAVKKRVVWVPHSASPDFMLAFNEHPENAIFLSGAISDYYPLRQVMQGSYERHIYPIVWHRHPGYHCSYDHERDERIGQGYAKKIHQYRVGFTDCLQYGYTVAKYFEIPATGALLLADGTVNEPLKQLGFVENVHYLPVSPQDLEEKIHYVLNERNHSGLDRIRRRGQILVWEKHKASDRAKQIDQLCRPN